MQDAMHGKMGTHNTVPILHHTARSNRMSPVLEEHLSRRTPRRSEALQERVVIGTQELAPLAMPMQSGRLLRS